MAKNNSPAVRKRIKKATITVAFLLFPVRNGTLRIPLVIAGALLQESVGNTQYEE